jgi:hypothetical protein
MRQLFAVALSLTLGAVARAEETVEIDARSDDPVFSSPLIDGQWYLLEASGTYRWNLDGWRADVEWLQAWNPGGPSWEERQEYYRDDHNLERYCGMELLVNGADTFWMGSTDAINYAPHVFSEDHVYRQYILGTSSPASFLVYDWPGHPGNDEGSLSVRITPIPEPSTFVLFGFGALCLLGYGWRRRQRAIMTVPN